MWTTVPIAQPDPTSSLSGVAMVSSNDVWAVGTYGQSPGHPWTTHWDGSSWTTVPAPAKPIEDSLFDADVVSSGDLWAVGEGDNPVQTLIEHWNGSAWTILPSDSPGSPINLLYGVDALSGGSAWAVGGYSDATVHDSRPIILRWDGTSWTQDTPPPTVVGGEGLYDVFAVSPTDSWAVGAHTLPGNISRTLIEHCSTPPVGGHVVLDVAHNATSGITMPSPLAAIAFAVATVVLAALARFRRSVRWLLTPK